MKYMWGHGNGKWPGQMVSSLERGKKIKRMIETREPGDRDTWKDMWEQAQSLKNRLMSMPTRKHTPQRGAKPPRRQNDNLLLLAFVGAHPSAGTMCTQVRWQRRQR